LAGAAGTGAGFAGAVGAEFGFTVTDLSGTGSTGAVVAGEDCAAGEAPDSFNAHPDVGNSNNIKQQLESSRLDIIFKKSPYVQLVSIIDFASCAIAQCVDEC
jgi:hypothetical protein